MQQTQANLLRLRCVLPCVDTRVVAAMLRTESSTWIVAGENIIRYQLCGFNHWRRFELDWLSSCTRWPIAAN